MDGICRHCGQAIETSPSRVTAPTGYIHVTTGSSYCDPDAAESTTMARP